MIAGGGIGGLTAALALANAGHEVRVLEQGAEFGEVGAGIQLSPNCTRVLDHLGVLPGIAGDAFVPEATEFRRFSDGELITRNPLADHIITQYGFPYLHVHRADLLQQLLAAAEAHAGIELQTSMPVVDVQDTGSEVVTVAGGTHFTSDVLVGADGIHSRVREWLWGKAPAAFTGNVAWRMLVPASRLGTLVRPVTTVWWGPGKHFVHYYVRRGELVNCVCVVEKDGWETESWTEPGDRTELKSDFAGWHPQIQALIDEADASSLYRWALHDRPPMDQWGRGRVTLLGDACHPTLPFLAQGAAMAIEDAAVLTACLMRDTAPERALDQYENLRRERTAMIQRNSRRNAGVFHLTGVKAWLRDRAARVAGNRLMDELYRYDALGVVGDGE